MSTHTHHHPDSKHHDGYPQRPGRWVACGLSLLLPGLGQLYAGLWLNAIGWFAVVVFAYVMMPYAGVALHLLCVCSAAIDNRYRKLHHSHHTSHAHDHPQPTPDGLDKNVGSPEL